MEDYLEGLILASDKINSIYQGKYPEKTLSAVNILTGLDLKYYVVVDTDALKALVDSIGGVYFDVPIDYLEGSAQKEKPTVNDDELKNNPLIAMYGEIGEYLDDDDLDDIATLMRLRAEIKKNKKG